MFDNAAADKRPRRKRAFLHALADTVNVARACRKAGIPRRTAYDWRDADPDFARRWNDALDDGIDLLEAELHRRAFEGVEKPVWHKGEQVGTTRHYSDALAMFLLKAHRPERYRDNYRAPEAAPAGADPAAVTREFRGEVEREREQIAAPAPVAAVATVTDAPAGAVTATTATAAHVPAAAAMATATVGAPPPRAAPDLSLEASLPPPVAGIDEAGRGPWAGPVVAAAVILPAGRAPDGIDDSKRLSRERRAELCERIRASATVGVGAASVGEIDALNVLQATMLAMRRAVEALATPPSCALVDGNRLPALACPARAIVGGDSRSLSIAAASIVAKETRDRIMRRLARLHPGYGWERNAGYGVREHARALDALGPTPHHRRSFRPVREAVSR